VNGVEAAVLSKGDDGVRLTNHVTPPAAMMKMKRKTSKSLFKDNPSSVWGFSAGITASVLLTVTLLARRFRLAQGQPEPKMLLL
jgi:hypothetical protein